MYNSDEFAMTTSTKNFFPAQCQKPLKQHPLMKNRESVDVYKYYVYKEFFYFYFFLW